MKSWHLTAAVFLVCAFLVYRVIALDQRLDALAQTVGDDETPPAAVDKAPVVVDHADRIEELEEDLARLREELSLVEQEAEAKVDVEDLDETMNEDRILSVVTSEAERIRDRHIEFQRDRWMEYRGKALADFVDRFGVPSLQEERLRVLLKDEVDSMSELLKSKDVLENPEQAASDWATILRETDRQAEALLTPEQAENWRQARFLERRILWPWLPLDQEP